MSQPILIVEDDASILRGLQLNLTLEGLCVLTARDGEEGLAAVRRHQPELVVLDLMLPHRSGFDVIRDLQQEQNNAAILVLSARSDEADKVLALSLGADDYVTKPFGVAELVARIRALLRRRRRSGEAAPETSDIQLDVATRRILVRGREIESTAREFDLLRFFMERPGIVWSREQLMQQVWGDASGTPRTIDNFVARLRAKIEPDGEATRHLETVRGVGYRFVP